MGQSVSHSCEVISRMQGLMNGTGCLEWEALERAAVRKKGEHKKLPGKRVGTNSEKVKEGGKN